MSASWITFWKDCTAQEQISPSTKPEPSAIAAPCQLLPVSISVTMVWADTGRPELIHVLLHMCLLGLSTPPSFCPVTCDAQRLPVTGLLPIVHVANWLPIVISMMCCGCAFLWVTLHAGSSESSFKLLKKDELLRDFFSSFPQSGF